MAAQFPVAGPVDPILSEATDYLVRSLHEFRLKLKAFLQPPKSSKAPAAVPPGKPTHATIWVAKTCK